MKKNNHDGIIGKRGRMDGLSPELSSSLSGHVLPNPQKTTSFSVLFHLIPIFFITVAPFSMALMVKDDSCASTLFIEGQIKFKEVHFVYLIKKLKLSY